MLLKRVNGFVAGASKKLLLLTILFCVFYWPTWQDWRGKPTPFISDADQYYSYVIATFIYHDPGFGFGNSYWLVTAKNGARVPKVTMGLAYLYLPSFVVGHAIAKLGGYETTGYSAPYAHANYFSGVLFVLIGLFVLRKVLLRHFSEAVTTLTLVSVFFGSNLLYYTLGWNIVSHSYLFALFTFILYAAEKWYDTYALKYLLLLGFLSGLCVLIRPTEIVLLAIPLLYKVNSFAELKERLALLWTRRGHLILAACMALLPWIPQMIYWKIYTGEFLFYSYEEEGFYFTDPKIFDVLLSYRKGWLVYTPIMVFALAGFFVMLKKCPAYFWGMLIQFAITLYLVSAWWAWWWGGCFGMRALVQSYAFLAFPMASFYAWIYTGVWKKALLFVSIAGLSYYSMCQEYKYKICIIHWDSMTKEAFWYSFDKLEMNAEQRQKMESLLSPPDYSKKGPQFPRE